MTGMAVPEGRKKASPKTSVMKWVIPAKKALWIGPGMGRFYGLKTIM